jgi:hypothetical protein
MQVEGGLPFPAEDPQWLCSAGGFLLLGQTADSVTIP